jgi:DNA-cytosine methyltransferase
MRYFSLFSGVGGFEIGIQKAYEDISKKSRKQQGGNEKNCPFVKQEFLGKQQPACVGLSEFDPKCEGSKDGIKCNGYHKAINEFVSKCPKCGSTKQQYASQVLRYRFPKVRNYGDIKEIKWAEVPDFDLLVGGSPCQDFSIAGKRKGILGERSGLVWEFIRCLEEKKPRYFIWENVRGAMSSRRGYDFANIITAFSQAGYSLWWQVLNAKDFGVPQNRERIFVCGFRGERPGEVFFEPGDDQQTLKELSRNKSQGYRVYDTKGIATNQASQAGGGRG